MNAGSLQRSRDDRGHRVARAQGSDRRDRRQEDAIGLRHAWSSREVPQHGVADLLRERQPDLVAASAQGATAVHIRSDSLLLVQQMRGRYKVKNAGLLPLYGQARLLAARIGRVTYEHVRRELNTDADRLANQAMDAGTSPEV